jgi:hypothetical protein
MLFLRSGSLGESKTDDDGKELGTGSCDNEPTWIYLQGLKKATKY